MVGGPSQMDLFDYKPEMVKWYDEDLPDSIRKGQRLTTMTQWPGAFPDCSYEVSLRSEGHLRHVDERRALAASCQERR